MPETTITVTTSLGAIRGALADGRAALASLPTGQVEVIERAINFGEIAADNIERLNAEAEAAWDKVLAWQEAASYTEGPEDCLERDCEEYCDEHGHDNGNPLCSHLTITELTPSLVSEAVIRSESLKEAHEVLRRLEAAESWSEISEIFGGYSDHREQDGGVSYER